MIQRMLAIWSLVALPFLNRAWTSESSRFMYCWSLAWRILSITLVCLLNPLWTLTIYELCGNVINILKRVREKSIRTGETVHEAGNKLWAGLYDTVAGNIQEAASHTSQKLHFWTKKTRVKFLICCLLAMLQMIIYCISQPLYENMKKNYITFDSSKDFHGGWDSKASAYNVGDLGSIPVSGRSPGEGIGNPLQYSCLENSMDGSAW